jgi:hypothetical protein
VKHETTKKLVGIVCAIHGTFDVPKCPICMGFHANGGRPSCPGGCGATAKLTRRFAFLPVVHNDRAYPGGSAIILGRADEGTRGYTALKELGTFTTIDAAKHAADHLNGLLGLDKQTASMIALSTMHVRESEMGRVIKAGLDLIDRVAMGTAEQDELDEWKEEARRYAHD